jgi:NADH:ubiquinone oxidoreductase subunit 5 (subunit L)/multisubunit Na+/H+ antiporter MnhA subunit
MQSPSDEVVSDALRWIVLHTGFIFIIYASIQTDEIKIRAFIISASIFFVIYTIGTHQGAWNLAITLTWNAFIIIIQSFRMFRLVFLRRRYDRGVFKDDLLFAADGLSGETFDQHDWN